MSDSSEIFLPESIAATPETSPLADSRDDGVCIIPKGVRVIKDNQFGSNENIRSIVIPDSVVAIEKRAFHRLEGLESVTVSKSVKSIGEGAFHFSGSLKEITVDGDNPVFASVDGVLFSKDMKTLIRFPQGKGGEYIIPQGVVTISEDAFSWCSKLTGVTIPEGVTEIGKGAFEECRFLRNITIPDSVTSIGSKAFANCRSLESIRIPEGVKSISFCMFLSSGLKDITIPESVTEIRGHAFYGCSGLTDIVIPESVRKIEHRAFSRCNGLTDIRIPEGVESIDDYIFAECDNLERISIPASLTDIKGITDPSWEPDSLIGFHRIKGHAFQCCPGLKEIAVAEDNPVFASADGVLFSKDRKTLFSCPRGKEGRYSIPEGVETIEDEAFWECCGLTKIIIPKSVSKIGKHAFAHCRNLRRLFRMS